MHIVLFHCWVGDTGYPSSTHTPGGQSWHFQLEGARPSTYPGHTDLKKRTLGGGTLGAPSKDSYGNRMGVDFPGKHGKYHFCLDQRAILLVFRGPSSWWKMNERRNATAGWKASRSTPVFFVSSGFFVPWFENKYRNRWLFRVWLFVFFSASWVGSVQNPYVTVTPLYWVGLSGFL